MPGSSQNHCQNIRWYLIQSPQPDLSQMLACRDISAFNLRKLPWVILESTPPHSLTPAENFYFTGCLTCAGWGERLHTNVILQWTRMDAGPLSSWGHITGPRLNHGSLRFSAVFCSCFSARQLFISSTNGGQGRHASPKSLGNSNLIVGKGSQCSPTESFVESSYQEAKLNNALPVLSAPLYLLVEVLTSSKMTKTQQEGAGGKAKDLETSQSG